MPGPFPAPGKPPGSSGSLRESVHPKKPSSQLPRQSQEAAKVQQSGAWKEELREVSMTIGSPQHSSPCEIWEPVLPLTQLGRWTPAKPPGPGRAGRSAIPRRTPHREHIWIHLHVKSPSGTYIQESRGGAELSGQAGGSWQPCQGPRGLPRAPTPWSRLGPRPHTPCASQEGRGIGAESFQPD